MAISDTITSMYENVGNVYDVLELAGADLTNVDKNIENLKQSWEERLLYFLANGTDVVWNNWLPKINGTGETITLNNTIEAKMDFVYKGNTYQETTTGKNLLRYDLAHLKNINTTGTWNDNVYTSNGLTITINDDLSVKINGTSTAQETFFINNEIMYISTGTYYLSGAINGSNTTYDIRTYNYNSSRITSQCFTGAKETAFVNNNQIFNIAIVVRNGQTLNNVLFYPMLSTTNDTSYEPYTNGASPNPDYPQDIQVVSGDNTIKVEGKNLFNKNDKTLGYRLSTNGDLTSNVASDMYVSNFIKVKENTQYVKNSPTADAYHRVCFYTNNNQSSFISKSENNTFTTPVNCNYIRFCGYQSELDTTQFERGDTSTTYEQYQGTTYPISLGNIELCKIGTYQDKIYKDNGKWYLNKQIGKVVYNGSESGRWTPSVNGGFTRFAGPSISNAQQIVSRLQMKSNYFHYLSSGNEIGGGFIYAGQFFAYPNQTITTEQNFRDWLSTHNTTVYYVLATPTTTEITDTTLISQLEAIKKSYNTQTNISQTNNDMPFELDVVALGELD